MKPLALPLLLLLAAAPLLLAFDSATVWPTLDGQVDLMAQAVQTKDTSSLLELEHVIGDEVTGLRRDPVAGALGPMLDEIAKWSAAAAHAAKDSDWKSADIDPQNCRPRTIQHSITSLSRLPIVSLCPDFTVSSIPSETSAPVRFYEAVFRRKCVALGKSETNAM